MPNRNMISENYRFGYQGQFAEKDEETGWNSFQLRMWDGRIGRWSSMDPAGQYASTYLGMGNNPVNGVDADGQKWFRSKSNSSNFEWFTGWGAIKAFFSSEWKMTPYGGTTTNFGDGWTYTVAPMDIKSFSITDTWLSFQAFSAPGSRQRKDGLLIWYNKLSI
jgi:RHS repeat-associated protein